MWRWTMPGALLACAAVLAVSWLTGAVMVRGASSTTARAKAPARDFTLSSSDGVTLAATFWPGDGTDAPAVLLLHGVGASRDAVAPTARWLATLGYPVLTIDFRGHGESTITPRSFGWFEAADAHAAFNWLKHRQHGGRVAVIGISMGGAAALMGPEGAVPADALVLQAVYPDIRHAIRNRGRAVLGTAGGWLEPLLSIQALPRFGVWPGALSPLHALAKARTPVLVIGGADDRYTPPDETRSLFAAAPAGKRTLWLAPGVDHAATCSLDTPAYREVLAGFLRRTLGQPRRDTIEPAPGGSADALSR